MKPNHARIAVVVADAASAATAEAVTAAIAAAAAAAAILDDAQSRAGNLVSSTHNPSHTKEPMNFSQLGLADAHLRVCQSLGYLNPTPIQTKVIPMILKGDDVIGCAETGTGKTAAFLLPIIQNLGARARPGIRVLVLAPTRELALQIQKNYSELNHLKDNRSVLVIGGANIRTQIAELRGRATVVIATPGRLLDLRDRKSTRLNSSHLVISYAV